MINWLFFIIFILLSLGGFWAGYRYVSRWPAGLRRPLTWLSIAGIFFFALLFWRPDWEFNYLPGWLSPFVEIVNFIPLAMFYFGVSAGEMEKTKSQGKTHNPPFVLPGGISASAIASADRPLVSFTRRKSHTPLPLSRGDYKRFRIELIILAVIIFLYGVQRNSWLFAAPGIDPAQFTLVGNNKICLQSTGYTCGAASAVTLLKYWGIETTESEMAELTRTRRFSGVTIDGLARGILRKIQNADLSERRSLQVRLIHPDWNNLAKSETPFIVSTKLYVMVDHVVVVLKVMDDKVLIADPLSGQTTWSKQEFLARWRGEAIIISNQ